MLKWKVSHDDRTACYVLRLYDKTTKIIVRVYIKYEDVDKGLFLSGTRYVRSAMKKLMIEKVREYEKLKNGNL